jgi:transposase
MDKDIIKMSRKQLNKLDILSKANDGFVTVKEASEALGLSERQVKRLKKKVRKEGADGVIHGNTGRVPATKMPAATEAEILRLYSLQEHSRCNFSHFTEILEREYGIKTSYASVCRILKSNGFKSPKTKRRKKQHRRRKRREQAGLLLQMDATPYEWFRGDKRRYALHGSIDDATGQVTGLYMTDNECLHGYFEIFRRTVSNFGVPVSGYADRHTIFQSPNAKKHEIDASVPVGDTQLGRCLKELGVTLIAARSPQAKGRVERLWGTLQSRLPVEFAMKGITTVGEANAFLEMYIYEFNSNFAVEPQNTQNAFRKLDPVENIDHILCVKEKRVVDAGGVFSYGGKSFKVNAENFPLPSKAKIDVMVGARIGVMAAYKNNVMQALPFVPPKRKKLSTATIPRKASPPPENHAWKTGDKANIVTTEDFKFEKEETYRETVRLIERTLLGKHR